MGIVLGRQGPCASILFALQPVCHISMGFCQCGGIISPKGKCVECGRSDAVVQTEIAKTESTFTREGPLVVEKPANVVILEGGRTKKHVQERAQSRKRLGAQAALRRHSEQILLRKVWRDRVK